MAVPCKSFILPEYPCTVDMWDELKRQKRPIVVYGMGNGADKLISRFEDYGITISDFFASDGFVRGHSFRGYKILSFSEIKEKYRDFVIVLSFASNKPDVIDMLADLNEKYDLYVPDMPVAGVEEYFDREFFNLHYNEICAAYSSFEDDISRNTYAAIINYKLTGRMEYLLSAYSERDDIYRELPLSNFEVVIDAGAYNGDTLREAKYYFPNLKKAYAIEPDRKNFKKLLKYCEAENEFSVIPINAAVWSKNSDALFSISGNRNSSVNSTPSFEHNEEVVALIALDSVVGEKVDYIKYDVEGAEAEALLGTHNLISEHKPALLVSLYHRSKDIFSIVNYVKKKYPFYRLVLRRLRCLPAWEIDLLAIAREENNI